MYVCSCASHIEKPMLSALVHHLINRLIHIQHVEDTQKKTQSDQLPRYLQIEKPITLQLVNIAVKNFINSASEQPARL